MVQIDFADHVPHRGLGQLGNREQKVLDFDDRLFRIGNPVINDRIDPDGDIVFRDRLLVRNVHRTHTDVHFLIALENRDDQSPAWLHDADVLSQHELHALFILVDLLDGNKQDRNDKN